MSISAPVSPPPLRDGDRLTSDEFMRRYEATPDLKHVELIDGIVYMPSPISHQHGAFHSTMNAWLAIYAANTAGCRNSDAMTWIMGERDVPEPDLSLWILPDRGGQSRLEGDYCAGAPELVVEVAVSSHARDLGVKLKSYERAGVREYVVAVVSESKLIWHVAQGGVFQTIEPDPDGILRSRCLPGLWLDPAALWRLDLAGTLAVLQQGIESPEHAAFTESLAIRKL
ncbi:MAG TPA: Uma2 family endonuclease [Bryobacteraceae bacterium]|nr:Uma2 family endonuclease [Bryobacteraceae bacterium]